MRNPVTFERRAIEQDAVGQQVSVWNAYASAMVSIEPVRGRAYFQASAERADITHEIRMRKSASVLPRDRAVMGERVFDIRSVIDVSEMGRELVLMCVETLNAN
jgi:SPP1 family predicted phage head-tail adaptor